MEQEAHPALDKLTSKISTLNLERVRQIKSRLVAITGRVQKVLIFFAALGYVCYLSNTTSKQESSTESIASYLKD